jgi:hypothetical protein
MLCTNLTGASEKLARAVLAPTDGRANLARFVGQHERPGGVRHGPEAAFSRAGRVGNPLATGSIPRLGVIQRSRFDDEPSIHVNAGAA